MSTPYANSTARKNVWRLTRWFALVIYTVCLPYVVLVYRAIVEQFSPRIVAQIPLSIIFVLALIYIIVGIGKNKTTRCFVILAASGVIVMLVMHFETNANKYIHIPEYILMAWILYSALSIDYRGSGILLLVFICAAMLGVVDEIMQGIHPQRSYGWPDMVTDAASSFIGCLTLLGLTAPSTKDWTWRRNLATYKGSLPVVFFGLAAAVLTCRELFRAQNHGGYLTDYPGWLVAANIIFVLSALILIVSHYRRRPAYSPANPGCNHRPSAASNTTRLWVICPLVILVSMHSLVLWALLVGVNFQ